MPVEDLTSAADTDDRAATVFPHFSGKSGVGRVKARCGHTVHRFDLSLASRRSATISSNNLATLRFVLRAASSRLAFIAEDRRHVYTSLLRDMHYSVMQS